MDEMQYTLKDFHELLEMVLELNMEDEENLVVIDELREIIELVGKINKHYKYSGWAGMHGVNHGLRQYINHKRYKENKLTTYLSWWIKQGIEKALGLGDFA